MYYIEFIAGLKVYIYHISKTVPISREISASDGPGANFD